MDHLNIVKEVLYFFSVLAQDTGSFAQTKTVTTYNIHTYDTSSYRNSVPHT